MDRNPNWTREEILLTLDLYLQNRNSPPGKESSEVLALSDLLRDLFRAKGGSPSETYRNPAGVYLKMMNFRAFDPQYTEQGKVGMTRSSKLDRMIWDEFEADAGAVKTEATLVRDAIRLESTSSQTAVSHIEEEVTGEEGGLVLRIHKRRERDRKLVRAKINQAAKNGPLLCEVCGFDFEATYGNLGSGYIEVHHLNPVHLMKPGMKTRLDDLALLCANCHRMAHRKNTTVSIKELRKAVEDQSA